jgi:hypothetical protein
MPHKVPEQQRPETHMPVQRPVTKTETMAVLGKNKI